MAFVTWLRALNAVGTVAEATRFFRGTDQPAEQPPSTVEPPGTLETRLANVLVAALREAFDRDRARFDLERDLRDAEEARKERALRLEWLRRTGTQALTHARYLAALSVAVWVVSVAAAGWLSPLSAVSKTFLGLGWAGLSAAVAAAFVTHQQLTVWLAEGALATDAGGDTNPPSPPVAELPSFAAQTALPWIFLGGFVATALSLAIEL